MPSTYESPQVRLCLVRRSLLVNSAEQTYARSTDARILNATEDLPRTCVNVHWYLRNRAGQALKEASEEVSHLRERKCRFKWVVRVNFAGHREQNLVWGSEGMLPYYAIWHPSVTPKIVGIRGGPTFMTSHPTDFSIRLEIDRSPQIRTCVAQRVGSRHGGRGRDSSAWRWKVI